jgi:hypothetical protein
MVVGVRGVARERALSACTAGRGRQRSGLPWASSQAAATWVAAQTPPAAAAMISRSRQEVRRRNQEHVLMESMALALRMSR